MASFFSGLYSGDFRYDVCIYTGAQSRINTSWIGLKPILGLDHHLRKAEASNIYRHDIMTGCLIAAFSVVACSAHHHHWSIRYRSTFAKRTLKYNSFPFLVVQVVEVGVHISK